MMRRVGTCSRKENVRDFSPHFVLIKCTMFRSLIELCEIQTYATNDTSNIEYEQERERDTNSPLTVEMNTYIFLTRRKTKQRR